jgi:general secretion pathway protein A
MYDEFYQFRTLPFENTPDPRFFFASEQHREALAAIEYTIRMRKGFVLITGEIGSGKTTVGRTMCHRCGDEARIVLVTHGHQDGTGLIRQVMRALDLPAQNNDARWDMLERLRQYLIEQLQRGRPVVLLVDEAQTLSDEALEELRLLSNFDTAQHKPVQIVLVGQPELRPRIASQAMSALRQRIIMAKHLRPMTVAETGQYIRHRIKEASVDPEHVAVEFDDAAVGLIHRHTGGVPRLINVVCDNCLLLGLVEEARRIEPNMVRKVLQDMVSTIEAEPAGLTAAPADQPLSLVGSY